jgi:CubicO group peptidase (beta-lactamase class C family)
MIPSPPAIIAAAATPFPTIAPELVVMLKKRARVQGTLVAIGRLVGDDARVDGYNTDNAPKFEDKTRYPVDGVTEVLTAALLADAVRRGEVRLDEPVSELHLPGLQPLPRDGKPLTLLDLATHHARMPTLPLAESRQPYATLDRAALVALANGPPAPAGTHAPSPVDFALLGLILAERTGTPYPTLLHDRVLVPLGMSDSSADPAADDQLVPLRSIVGDPVAPWRYAALAPAGGARSTAFDLLRFAAALFTDDNGPLADDMRLTAVPRGDGSVGLGWHIDRATGAFWADGGSYGATTFIGVQPQAHVAVVILCNVGITFGNATLDDVGLRLLAATAQGHSP